MTGGATRHSERGRDDASARETARYIADLAAAMSVLARRSRLDVVAYLLDLARLEAEETVQNGEFRE